MRLGEGRGEHHPRGEAEHRVHKTGGRAGIKEHKKGAGGVEKGDDQAAQKAQGPGRKVFGPPKHRVLLP